MYIRLCAAVAVSALTAVAAMADDAKSNDAQNAHIAYTTGQIDISSACLAEVQKQGGARLCREYGSRPQGRERSSPGAGE
jgi:hypothetical protein